MPDGVRLVFQPAYTPQVQPAETLWTLVDEPVVNKHIPTLEALDEIISMRCAALASEREKIRGQSRLPLVAENRQPEVITRKPYDVLLFAARRVQSVADGHKHRMLDNRMQGMPGDEVWLVGERRSTGEQKYYVSNLPADTSLKRLAATRSKPDGSVSRHISSSRRNSASTTSKADPGSGYTGMP